MKLKVNLMQKYYMLYMETFSWSSINCTSLFSETWSGSASPKPLGGFGLGPPNPTRSSTLKSTYLPFYANRLLAESIQDLLTILTESEKTLRQPRGIARDTCQHERAVRNLVRDWASGRQRFLRLSESPGFVGWRGNSRVHV